MTRSANPSKNLTCCLLRTMSEQVTCCLFFTPGGGGPSSLSPRGNQSPFGSPTDPLLISPTPHSQKVSPGGPKLTPPQHAPFSQQAAALTGGGGQQMTVGGLGALSATQQSTQNSLYSPPAGGVQGNRYLHNRVLKHSITQTWARDSENTCHPAVHA